MDFSFLVNPIKIDDMNVLPEKVDLLGIGVHPDDVELDAIGTLISHKQMGKTFGLLDLTRGELGTRGSAELRTQEAMRAAELSGAQFRHQLTMADGFFTQDKEALLEIIRIIRAAQPEIVLCNAKADRHPDHGRASKLVQDACFYAGLSKIETAYNGKRQKEFRPKYVYAYIEDHIEIPDLVVDVSHVVEQKRACILSFASQFYREGSTEPETPISSKDFMDYIWAKMEVFGRRAGFKYAEGFKTLRYPGVKDLFQLY